MKASLTLLAELPPPPVELPPPLLPPSSLEPHPAAARAAHTTRAAATRNQRLDTTLIASPPVCGWWSYVEALAPVAAPAADEAVERDRREDHGAGREVRPVH